jgi:hypothetical protein
MSDSFVEALERSLTDMIDRRKDALATGPLVGEHAFFELRGAIQGLAAARETLKDLAREKLKEDDDDDKD